MERILRREGNEATTARREGAFDMHNSDRTPGDPKSSPHVDARVTGVFRDRDGVSRAVRRLTAKSVPVDSIRVFVAGRGGRRRREIPVDDEAGALRGALVGAGVGAVAGAVLVLVAAIGLIGSEWADLFGISGIAGAVRAIAVCALAGVPLGKILGMGRWDATKSISESDVESGEVHVVVESGKLSAVARRVLDDAGAYRVE
jgi:hypothetical protein